MRAPSALFLFCALLLQSPAQCQDIQRLIIPSADVSIGPGGTAVIKTYCTDYGIEGPTQGTVYRHLLTAGDSTEVFVGGRRMTLQEAIDTHKLKLVTPKATVAALAADQEMFHSLDPTAPTVDIEGMMKLLSAEQRSRFLSEAQNEGQLKIVNLSGEKIVFRAKDAAVGVSDTPPPLIPDKTTSQTAVFISQIQHRLQADGYSVPSDGVLDPVTRSALKDFQTKSGLPATGEADEKVAQMLAAAEDLSTLKALVPDELVVLRLQNEPEQKSHFRITNLNGKQVFVGNQVHSMIDSIVAAAVQSGKPTYVDPTNLSQRQIDDLANNLRLADSEIPIGVFPKPGASSVPRDVFFARGARMERIEVQAEKVTTGERQGWFRSVVTFLTNAHGRLRRVTVEVWTRTAEQMAVFLDSLKSYSGSNATDSPSIAIIVARGRKNIFAGGGKAKDVDVQIQSATYRFWAGVERPAAQTAGM
jgi:peptidoglycan hydrolase-like protein with peptidoglycan-binding domain